MMRAGDVVLGPRMSAAAPSDGERIGAITAAAFARDPVNLWLFRNFAGIRALFDAQAQRIYVPRGFAYRLGDDTGACMWALPEDDVRTRTADRLAIAWAILSRSGPGAVRRALATGAAMERHHPRFPHAYLFSIGVKPAHQGKGLGRVLIAPVLEACDRHGLPAYLENSNPANTVFYRSCGFEPQAEFRPRPDAPPMLAMLRPPR